MNRRDFLAGLIGSSWLDRGMCWGLARHVQQELFGRILPDAVIPPDPDWGFIIRAIAGHEERTHWRELPPDPMGLIRAGDGALMLMARTTQPAHIGVWLKPEGGVIHAPTVRKSVNAVFETPVQLRTSGWMRQILFEPIAG